MIDECKKFKFLNVGFIDPDKVHNETVRDNPVETENSLLRFLTKQKDRDSILFSLQLQVRVLALLYTFMFSY